MDENLSGTSLFEQLKQRRIEKNIELKEIAQKTHIAYKYLQALEEGRLQDIPEVYNRLFFQSYLTYLKIEDHDKLLDEFKKLLSQKPDQSIAGDLLQHIAAGTPEKSWKNFLSTYYIYIPVAIFVALIALLVWHSTGVKKQAVKVQELPISAAVEELVEKKKSLPDSVAVADSLQQKKVTVRLKAEQRSWVLFVKDRRDSSEYMMQPGNQLSFEADSVMNFVVGNAGGIKFFINGQESGLLGQNGDVISSLRINRAGIAEKKLRKAVKKETSNETPSVN